MSDSLESKIEQYCNTILTTDAENWDAKNRAILQMTTLVQSFQGKSPEDIQDAFTVNMFRSLKEPIKQLV